MIIGMIPMALGLGEGGEQNAPLGRAVIGGLLFATVSTLLFVPVLYAGVHERLARRAARRARRPPPCPRKADRTCHDRYHHPSRQRPAAAPGPALDPHRHHRGGSCCWRWAPPAR
jgi:hypothetical protein